MGNDNNLKIDTYTIIDAPRDDLNSSLIEIFEIEPNKRHEIRSFIDPFYTRITCSNTSDRVASFKFLDEKDYRIDIDPQTVVSFKRKVNGKIMAFLNIGESNITIKVTQE